jgi:hypothetical protein
MRMTIFREGYGLSGTHIKLVTAQEKSIFPLRGRGHDLLAQGTYVIYS